MSSQGSPIPKTLIEHWYGRKRNENQVSIAHYMSTKSIKKRKKEEKNVTTKKLVINKKQNINRAT